MPLSNVLPMSMDTCYPCLRSVQGEGRGEGIATKPKTLLSPFLIGADKKEDGGEFSLLVTQLHPPPNPLPMGEGVYLQNLGMLDR